MKNAPLFIKVDVSGGICKRFVGRESVKKHFGSFLFFAVFWVVEVSIITKLPPSSYKPAPVLQLRHMVKQNFSIFSEGGHKFFFQFPDMIEKGRA